MAALAQAQAASAALVVMFLLCQPMIAVMIPNFIFTEDHDSVLLVNSCIRCTSQTVFAICLLETLIACVLLQAFVIPALFGWERWKGFDSLKQRKLVGFVIKILVRVACAVQLLALVAPRMSMSDGLFSNFNVKRAVADQHNALLVETCQDAGMTIRDADALRSWALVRNEMMAVMIWELAFIPELPADAWLHHLFVVFGVIIGSDPILLHSRAPIQPLIDGIAFFLVLGAAFAALVEAAVLMYHLSWTRPVMQARWMLMSMAVQGVLILIFFVGIPAVFALSHYAELGWLTYGILALLVFLAVVEIHMMVIKWAIVRSARRKAHRKPSSMEPPRSFTHDLALILDEDDSDSQASESSAVEHESFS